MIAAGTRTNAERRQRQTSIDGVLFRRSDWMDCGEDSRLSPSVFLVDQEPNTTLVPHFHRNNQFQLFVGGSGTIGRHEVGAFLVHYAGAYAGYGPLVAEPQGVRYFTIRAVRESGFTPITDREKMLRGPKCHAQSKLFGLGSTSGCEPIATVEEETLIALTPHGMGATLTRIPPDARHVARAAPASQGQFLMVLAGTVQYGGTKLGMWESLFVSEDEVPLQLEAGDRGAEIVAMHMPHHDAAYPRQSGAFWPAGSSPHVEQRQ